MKPVPFDYERPRDVAAATALLGERGDAKVLAGAQTLGPMLNLRLVQPGLLVDITRISELVSASDEGDALSIGACVTHAAIEDGRIGDPARGYLRRVAAGIAYRAVRTRGTIGGSLAHADPAADWLNALLALGAELEIAGQAGKRRRVALKDFVRGAMETDLAPDELLARIRVPRQGKSARAGFHKICRKTGEFAEAIGAVLMDRGGGRFRMVAGGGSEAPILFDDPAVLFAGGDPFGKESFDIGMAIEALRAAGMENDGYAVRLRAVAMARAVEDAHRS